MCYLRKGGKEDDTELDLLQNEASISFRSKTKKQKSSKKLRKRNMDYCEIIYEWKSLKNRERDGLYALYRHLYGGDISAIIIPSLSDIGNRNEQADFIERMQELEIPVFCLKDRKKSGAGL